MSTSHEAIHGSTASLRPIRRALLSVSDKTHLVAFAQFLSSNKIELLSTGGTAKLLRDNNLPVTDVSALTASPEILHGRVKTLHPLIHGGILAVRGNPTHEEEVTRHHIPLIDLVVVNLYPFSETVASGAEWAKCVENVDIGGPAMLRAAAKNYPSVAVASSPAQYALIQRCMEKNDLCTDEDLRLELASAAFMASSEYDTQIAHFLRKDQGESSPLRLYPLRMQLKYGCNPNQIPAMICGINNQSLPFEVLNGRPGYINLLDALNAWQLVKELRESLGLPAAASFKHVSPAGAAVAAEDLSDAEMQSYGMSEAGMGCVRRSRLALAFVRARQADPMSSFGDFIALSEEVDEATALLIKNEVSDGVIAPAFSEAAMEILRAKKKGAFIVLRSEKGVDMAGKKEVREVFGAAFVQGRNECVCSVEQECYDAERLVTKRKMLSAAAKRDLVVGNIAIKYTQSNSVAFVKNGQVVGVGAGQQSRVDCVKLAGKKAKLWLLRQHPRVAALAFRKGIKRQDRINATVAFIEKTFDPFDPDTTTGPAKDIFAEDYPYLTVQEVNSFLEGVVAEEKLQGTGVAVCSDAFFPFRDNIDVCQSLGINVSFVAQAGGSIKDEEVIAACDEHGMAMAFTGQRLFHH